MRVGVVGLGDMGAAMAANLLTAGHEVTVWNRSPGKDEALVAKGARRVATPREAATGDAVFTMVFDDDATEQVTFGDDGILAAEGSAIHLCSVTIGLPLVERLAAAHRATGRPFVSAPVFGRPEAAQAARLFVVAAGADSDLDRVQPLFDAIGQRTFRMGATPAAANIVKLAGNAMIGAVGRTLFESMTLAEPYGVDRQALLDVLTGTLFDAPVVRTYGGMLVRDGSPPNSAIFAKDAGLAVDAAQAKGVAVPLIATVRDQARAALAAEN